MIAKIETRQDGTGNAVTEQKYNHLAPAEMMNEDNINKIDVLIDTSSRPTFEERMKDAKNKAKQHNSRKSDRHKGARHNQKADRHKIWIFLILTA